MESLLGDFARVRGAYVEHMRSGLANARSKPVLAAEVLVKPNGRDTPEPFCLARVDALTGDLASPRVLRFAESRARPVGVAHRIHGDLLVLVESCSWESLTVAFEHAGFDVGMLADWYERWLDVRELRQADADGLSGVVHALAWSSGSGGKWRLSVDLGSAEVGALTELLGVLEHAGVRHCSLAQVYDEDAQQDAAADDRPQAGDRG